MCTTNFNDRMRWKLFSDKEANLIFAQRKYLHCAIIEKPQINDSFTTSFSLLSSSHLSTPCNLINKRTVLRQISEGITFF